jgi:cyclic pyranopterin monophosphate synthase
MEIITPSPRSADNSSFRMIDVGAKVATHRRAIAQGSIELAEDAFIALRDRKNPKGDVLALAEAAGIMAAKRTADTIPLCHPLPLDYVRLSFELHHATHSLTVFCEAGTTAKTGVEMEALAGVNGALLTIYDLSKAVNPALTISNIRLNTKEGGKSGTWTHPSLLKSATEPVSKSSATQKELANIRVAVVTISDRVSARTAQDRSGPFLTDNLSLLGAQIVGHKTVWDDIEKIQTAVRDLIRSERAELVITTGGTGLSPRDVTPEALEKIAQRKIPGIGELLRESGAKHIKTAWLSRSIGCVIEHALVIALPGSQKAVAESLEVLVPILPHALHTLRGGDHG